ncbi:16453_t:CDS:2 [Cetraspora pellucida]|uniref:16453_t:CDS:1 n=1 Tax=Cetraspora pellucida TaxID=1433469 RepID=A0ACA9KQK0_9GLOM|nr:16453_t:CDS:2 [Cetraspora pellucida]
MTNIRITPGELVVTGTIVPELHYGPYLCDWWIFSKDSQNVSYAIPLRLGLEIMIQLNKRSFIIHVVRYIHSHLQPGYICEGDGQSSGIVTSSSMAITSVYQAVFGTKAKFAGLSYLGLEQPKTSQKLLEGVVFYPFIIEIENLSIFVGSLGKITHPNQKTIGYNYTSSLFYKYKAKQSVFFQSIKNDSLYSIEIYQNSQIIAKFNENSPNAVWHKTGVLKSILGDTLFCVNHPLTLQKLDQTKFSHQKLMPDKCTLADWDNKMIMEHFFDLHLKKAVGKSIEEWHRVFQIWKQQKSNVIELHTHLNKVYSLDHELREREARAWRAIFCAVGCTNITPYNKQISKNEYWTNTSDPDKDRDILKTLYEDGILNISPQALTIKAFWDCFWDSYNANLKGTNDKVRILSIIAERFTYQKIIDRLNISPNTINAARQFSHNVEISSESLKS